MKDSFEGSPAPEKPVSDGVSKKTGGKQKKFLANDQYFTICTVSYTHLTLPTTPYV